MAILTVYSKLLDKTLDGVRIIDMGSTKPCECFVIPRNREAEVGKSYPRLLQYGFYILLGKEGNRQKAYIGHTYDFTQRVIDHKQKKDFWDKALVFVSKMNDIYASEAKYLEYLGLKAAKEANNYDMDNTQAIKEPQLSIDKQNDMELFFEDIVFLTRFYGCSVFDKAEKGNHVNYPSIKTPSNAVARKEKRVWLVPSNPNYFDLKGYLKRCGNEIFWTQHVNFQPGDTGYMYSALPDRAIRYSFEVIETNLPYNINMEKEREFNTNPNDFDGLKKHNRFALLRITGNTYNRSMDLGNLQKYGLKHAPQGAMILSNSNHKELLQYIEENF